MLKIRIAVCDDDAQEMAALVQTVRQVMERLSLNFSLETFRSAAELLQRLQRPDAAFDLFLLDILMEEISGMELACRIRESKLDAALIFITNSPDFAMDGYKVNASDYLLKPVTQESLAKSLNHVLDTRRMILLNFDGTMYPVRSSDVLFAESFRHYVFIHLLQSPEPVRVRASLPQLLEQLGDPRFSRCHKGYLVNLSRIARLDGSYILLQDGARIPLGRKYRQAVEEALVRQVERFIPPYGES